MKNLLLFYLVIVICSCSDSEQKAAAGIASLPPKASDEIFYHVVQRSFYDSNGDLHGDLKGLQQKLDYLQELGINSILLLPLYKSIYYHNYFADDFEQIDEEFGTKEDYLNLVEEIHKRGMRIYMDMEIHYVTYNHKWVEESLGNPESEFSEYIAYNGPGNTEPESIIFDLTKLDGFDGQSVNICTINLDSEKVSDYMKWLFRYWADPNEDGDFSDGVDGYRIDHMMDDMDWKGKWTGMLSNFWRPIIEGAKSVNPELKFIAEQSDWRHYGGRYFEEAGIDQTFAFSVMDAFESFNGEEIASKTDSTFAVVPEGKSQMIFLENHDTRRFASAVEDDMAKKKAGAALQILLRGTPCIYYGQEIGMKGVGGFNAFGQTDANDIPRREAFEWSAKVDEPGHALWYRDSGPWWDQTNLKDDDGISVEEQQDDPQSLLNYYRSLLKLRASSQALQSDIINFEIAEKNFMVFTRGEGEGKIRIIVNLSDKEKVVEGLADTSQNLITGNPPVSSDGQPALTPWEVFAINAE